MNISDFLRLAKNRSVRLAIDELGDFIRLDLLMRFDTSNRDASNKRYIPSPSRAIRKAIHEIQILDPSYRKDVFIDCAAGKGKPCLIALESGFKNLVAVEYDATTFLILEANLSLAAKRFDQFHNVRILDDFLIFSRDLIQIPIDSYLTFWLFDLAEFLPSFFKRIDELCVNWRMNTAYVIVLSESNLPQIEGWTKKTTIDLGYDQTRVIHIFAPAENKNSTVFIREADRYEK